MTSDNVPVVIDFGSCSVTCGIGGTNPHIVTIPNIVGTPIYPQRMIGMNSNSKSECGFSVAMRSGIHKISSTLKHGKIVDEEGFFMLMCQVTDHINWNVEPEEFPLLFTEHPQNPRSNREKLLEILMEQLNWKSVCFSNPASLIGPTIKNGIIVDCGHCVSTASPILDGKILESEVIRQDFAGDSVIQSIIDHLNDEGESYFSSSSRYAIFSTLTNNDEYINLGKLTKDYCSTFMRSDGNKISYELDTFYAPEILFNPSLIRSNKFIGIHEMIKKSISNCPINDQSLLLKKIYLCGGSTLSKNFQQC